MAEKVLIDCDPGHDDAVAILLAHGSPAIELVGITTVAGNQTLEKTTLNALRVASAAGITGVPIAAGCDHPLTRPLHTAADIHGESGLDGPSFGEPTATLADIHAVDLIIETVMSAPGEVTLVPVGPLTNIALAMRKEPRLVEATKRVVLMGGSYTRGNHTPAAEFNILVDPEAAAVVFEAPWDVTMVGLDLTHQALATPEVVQRIGEVGTPVAKLVVELFEFFGSTYERVAGFNAPPVHDPCAVALVADPAVMEVEDAFVAVETAGHWTSGMTVTDFRGRLGLQPNTRVATRLDFDRFWDLVVEALRAIG